MHSLHRVAYLRESKDAVDLWLDGTDVVQAKEFCDRARCDFIRAIEIFHEVTEMVTCDALVVRQDRQRIRREALVPGFQGRQVGSIFTTGNNIGRTYSSTQ